MPGKPTATIPPMRAVTVTLEDIEDCEAFVKSLIRDCLPNQWRIATTQQREELLQAGLARLVRMHRDYTPGHGGGQAATSRFSGYAARFLPGKLRDDWRRLNGQRIVKNSDGTRSWARMPPSVHLDALTEDDPAGADHLLATQHTDTHDGEALHSLAQALDRQWQLERTMTLQLAERIVDGEAVGDAVQSLGFRSKDVAASLTRIRQAIEAGHLRADAA